MFTKGEHWLGCIKAFVSSASEGLQLSFVGDLKCFMATESSLCLDESITTTSGSSCGKDCFLYVSTLSPGNLKPKSFPTKEDRKEYSHTMNIYFKSNKHNQLIFKYHMKELLF